MVAYQLWVNSVDMIIFYGFNFCVYDAQNLKQKEITLGVPFTGLKCSQSNINIFIGTTTGRFVEDFSCCQFGLWLTEERMPFEANDDRGR